MPFNVMFPWMWGYSWGKRKPSHVPGALPLDLMCVCVHAGFLLLPASEGSFVSQLRTREVSLPFPKAHLPILVQIGNLQRIPFPVLVLTWYLD